MSVYSIHEICIQVNNLSIPQLTQELEWMLGSDEENQRATQRWNALSSSILKQGTLESANGKKIFVAMANFPESRGYPNYH